MINKLMYLSAGCTIYFTLALVCTEDRQFVTAICISGVVYAMLLFINDVYIRKYKG